MADEIYNSSFTGGQIDEAVSDVRTNKGKWNTAATKADTNATAIASLQSSVEGDIAALSKDITENATAISNMNSTVSGQATDIEALQRAVQANQTTLGQKLNTSTYQADQANMASKEYVNGKLTAVVSGITVSSTGWVDETETTALWRYRIENPAILANMSVDVLFKVTDYTEEQASSLVRATNGGVLSATTSDVGYVDIYSTAQPDTDLVCDLVLTQLKVV